ncbi:hypothetical protein [Candidatus Leptofilum sp.]|uniref:hypothetical protein n=1 Tax=Candidatus Leptofilum sp. TaxID=3241576 RepID=UPI003B5C96CD
MKNFVKIVVVGVCLIIGILGLNFKTGDQYLLLEDYPQIEGYSMAIKYKSISLWQYPIYKSNIEYVAVKNYVAENDFILSANEVITLDYNTILNLEAQYGSFDQSLPSKYKFGWLAAVAGILIFIIAFVVVDGVIGAEIDVEIN